MVSSDGSMFLPPRAKSNRCVGRTEVGGDADDVDVAVEGGVFSAELAAAAAGNFVLDWASMSKAETGVRGEALFSKFMNGVTTKDCRRDVRQSTGPLSRGNGG